MVNSYATTEVSFDVSIGNKKTSAICRWRTGTEWSVTIETQSKEGLTLYEKAEVIMDIFGQTWQEVNTISFNDNGKVVSINRCKTAEEVVMQIAKKI